MFVDTVTSPVCAHIASRILSRQAFGIVVLIYLYRDEEALFGSWIESYLWRSNYVTRRDQQWLRATFTLQYKLREGFPVICSYFRICHWCSELWYKQPAFKLFRIVTHIELTRDPICKVCTRYATRSAEISLDEILRQSLEWCAKSWHVGIVCRYAERVCKCAAALFWSHSCSPPFYLIPPYCHRFYGFLQCIFRLLQLLTADVKQR